MIGNQQLFLLALSVAMLAAGPLIYYSVRKNAWILSALDGFVLISIGGFVAFFVLPHTLEAAGGWAILVALVGFLFPWLLSHLRSVTVRRAQHAALLIAVVGLILHAMLDGMALVMPGKNATTTALSWAVILHRLPMSLVIWMLVRPSFGISRAIAALVGIGIATGMGFGLGGHYFGAQDGPLFMLLEAFVGGSLLHVIIHRARVPEMDARPARRWKFAEVLGGLVGGVLVATFPDAGGHAGHAAHAIGHSAHTAGHAHHYGERLLQLALTSAPALFLGYLLAGALGVFMPRTSLRWLGKGSSLSQASRGMLFGLPLPICSCGVVPVYQSLIQRGVPATAAMAFLVATPELGVESLLLSVPLLGGSLTAMRLLSAFVVALLVGWLVGRTLQAPAAPETEEAVDGERLPLSQKLRQTMQIGFVDLVKDTSGWILLGLVIAAMLQPSSLTSLLAWLPKGTDILVFACLGIPVYVCASGATPLAAALIFSGVSPGAAIAFLLSGPATNITTFGVLSQLHRPRAAVLFGVGVIGLSVALGFVTNLVIPPSQIPTLHTHAHEGGHWLQWATFGFLSLAFSLNLLRLGPRQFLLSFLPSVPSDRSEASASSSESCCASDHAHPHEHSPQSEAQSEAESACCSSSVLPPVVEKASAEASSCCSATTPKVQPESPASSCCGSQPKPPQQEPVAPQDEAVAVHPLAPAGSCCQKDPI